MPALPLTSNQKAAVLANFYVANGSEFYIGYFAKLKLIAEAFAAGTVSELPRTSKILCPTCGKIIATSNHLDTSRFLYGDCGFCEPKLKQQVPILSYFAIEKLAAICGVTDEAMTQLLANAMQSRRQAILYKETLPCYPISLIQLPSVAEIQAQAKSQRLQELRQKALAIVSN